MALVQMTHSEIEEQDLIDLYLLGRLSPEQEEQFEEHFLGCGRCLDGLERSWQAIALVAEACRRGEVARKKTWRNRLFWRIPSPAWGLAAVLAAGGVYWTLSRPPASQQVPVRKQPGESLPIVQLESYRAGGAETAKLAAEVAAKPFLLRLDLRGLAPHSSYLVEVVGEAGQPVWSATGIAGSGGDSLEVRVETPGLKPGAYWVRLAGLGSDGQRQPLREYSLSMEE